MEPLFTVEETPKFGNIPDHLRGDGTVYEFGGPGDHYTMTAPSDKVAVMAIILISGGNNTLMIFHPGTAITPPLVFDPGMDKKVSDLFGAGDDLGETIGRYMAANYDTVLETLNSVLIGGVQERAAYMESIDGLGLDPQAIEAFRKKWSDKRRTSAYDLAELAHKTAAALAAMKEENVALYR